MLYKTSDWFEESAISEKNGEKYKMRHWFWHG